MPYLGASCEPWSSSDNEALEAMWNVLAAVRATGLPPIESWVKRVHDKIINRVPPRRLRYDLLTSLSYVDMSALTGDRLVHTDPHPGSIVRQHDGSLTLIDRETSFGGHPDITRACWLTIRGENSYPVTRIDHSVGVLKSASMASMTYHLSTSVNEALHTWSKHRPTGSTKEVGRV